MHPKDADGMADSVDPDQTASGLAFDANFIHAVAITFGAPFLCQKKAQFTYSLLKPCVLHE